jgi:hypothetical protein
LERDTLAAAAALLLGASLLRLIKDIGTVELWPRKDPEGFGIEVLRPRGADVLFIFRLVGPNGARSIIFVHDADDAQVKEATAWTRANATNGHHSKERANSPYEHLQPDVVVSLVDHILEYMPRRIVAITAEGVGEYNTSDHEWPESLSMH